MSISTTHVLLISPKNRMDNMKVNVIKNINPQPSPFNQTVNEVEEYFDVTNNKHINNLLGKHTFAFWMLFILLLILAAGNLILTITIFGVLHLGKGMESIEVMPEYSATKILNPVDLDNIIKHDGRIEGFSDAPVEIEVPNGSFFVNLMKNYQPYSKLKFNNNGIIFSGVQHFDIIDPISKEKIFQTDFTNLKLTKSPKNFTSNSITTNKIISPIDRDLNLYSHSKMHIQGTEGLHVESGEIFWSADQDIYLNSINGSLILNGKEGVFIDTQNMPIMPEETKVKYDTDTTLSYKLCICMPQGKLFRVPVLRGQNPRGICTRIKIDAHNNPCL